jgi:Flp pilus assembly protein TadG
MMLKSMLRRDQKGIGAVEFALVAPVFISFIIGISQVGRMFFANADMKSAMAAGARVAELYPVPSDATIIAAVNSRLMRTGASAHATPTVVHGTDGNGNAYVELRMTYSVPLEFIFFSPPPVTLHDTRRVFTQVTNANSTTYVSTTTSGSTTTGGTTSSTTTGGTTSATSASSTTSGSTSATSAGGTTSSTSATSAGGTTSATSASSTSASSTSASSTSASSTSASSTTSSGNNGSSGNGSSGNNGSSGHAHGNCSKC